MISRSGVCGLNFTKRSSFSTSDLRCGGLVPQGQPRIARSFNCGKTPPNKSSPRGAADKIIAGNSAAPPGLVGFYPVKPAVETAGYFHPSLRDALSFGLSKPWDESHGYHRGSLRDFADLRLCAKTSPLRVRRPTIMPPLTV